MIQTWQQRCEEHPDHEGIVSTQMIMDRMQEEIDELRQALAHEALDNMKIYCELCKKVQPVQIDNGVDVKTKKQYQDIVCAECGLVIASGTGIAQPRREWVGLTDEEIHEVASKKWWDWEDAFDIEGFIRAIEAKLKKKNHGE